MADEKMRSPTPEHRAHASDAEHGTLSTETSKLQALREDAAVDTLSRAHSSYPDQGSCLVHCAAEASVDRVADCNPVASAAGSRSVSSNTRTHMTPPRQGKPEFVLTALEFGACVNSAISHALDHANPTSHGLSRGNPSMKTRSPPHVVPVSLDSPSGAPTQKTLNITEGTPPGKSGDEESRPVKTAVRAGIIFEKANSSNGGNGETVGQDVFTVSTKYGVRSHESMKPPNDDVAHNTTVGTYADLLGTTGKNNTGDDRDERRCGSENRFSYTTALNQPDLRLIHNVVDDLIKEFHSQGIFRSPSGPLSQRHKTPFQDLLAWSESPKRTQSSLLDAGENRDSVPPLNTQMKTIISRRGASTTLQSPSPPDGASNKEPSPHENSENEVDLKCVLAACSVLESVTTDLSNEARQLSQSWSDRNAIRKRVENLAVHAKERGGGEAGKDFEGRGKTTGEKSDRVSKQKKSRRSNNVKATKKRRISAGSTIDQPRTLSKQNNHGDSEEAENTVNVLVTPYSFRPPFLGNSASPGHLQEGLFTSKPAQLTSAEHDFPQLAQPRQEQKDTNKEPPTIRCPFQATLDAAKHHKSLRSPKVNIPEGPIGTSSLIPTVPSLSSISTGLQQPGAVMVEKVSTHLSLPAPVEVSWPSLFYYMQPVPPADIDLTADLQKDDVTASGTSIGTSCSNSTYHCLTQEAGFGSEREMETHRADAGSTDSIISSAENRFNREPAKAIFGRRVSVSFITILACLFAGTVAYFVITAKRHQPWDITESEEDSGESTWFFSPLSNSESALTGNRPSCLSKFCSEYAAKLFRSFDPNVHPCQNFYGHVCPLGVVKGTGDEQLAQHPTLRVLSFLKANKDDANEEHPLVVASRHLWRDCVQLDTLSQNEKASLLALLNLTGLAAWPYDSNASLPDVWKVAGNLQRLMALAPLVELKGFSNGKARLTLGNLGGSDDADDVLDAMLALHPSRLRLRELAADVARLNRRLKNLRYRQAVSKSLDRNNIKFLPTPYLEAALTGLASNVGTVDIQLEPLIRPLVELVRDSRPQPVLNMLGYQLVRHVDLFTATGANADFHSGSVLSRESRCTRAILDDALSYDEAEYVRYAALREHLNFSWVRSVVSDVKSTLDAKLADQRWLDIRTRTRMQRHLREMKVGFFFEHYETSGEKKLANRTLALPSGGLATYQRFRESLFRTRVLHGDLHDDAGDQDCAYDEHKKVLFLRLSAVELRDPKSPLWPALQAARLGPRLSRCVLRVLLSWPTDGNVRAAVHWSATAHTRLDGLRACVRAQRARRSEATEPAWGPQQEALAVIDIAALEPARDVFRAYVDRLASKDPSALSTNGTARSAIERDRVFYLSYAHSMCEGPDHGRRLVGHTTHWETVNDQLSNDRVFHEAFQCRAGDPMRLGKTCSFWETSH